MGCVGEGSLLRGGGGHKLAGRPVSGPHLNARENLFGVLGSIRCTGHDLRFGHTGPCLQYPRSSPLGTEGVFLHSLVSERIFISDNLIAALPEGKQERKWQPKAAGKNSEDAFVCKKALEREVGTLRDAPETLPSHATAGGWLWLRAVVFWLRFGSTAAAAGLHSSSRGCS